MKHRALSAPTKSSNCSRGPQTPESKSKTATGVHSLRLNDRKTVAGVRRPRSQDRKSEVHTIVCSDKPGVLPDRRPANRPRLQQNPAPSSRREFLRRIGASVALGAATTLFPRTASAAAASSSDQESASTPPASLVGSNVVAWMNYADREKRTLDLPEVMKALHDCGYDYLEGRMNVEQPGENARFADQLRANGLRTYSIYAGATATLHDESKVGATVDALLAVAGVCAREGFRVLVCNARPIPSREKTDRELETQAAALTRLGTGLNALGMRLAMHDHLPGLASGARELRHNFQATAPDVVGFCYDVHWLWRGGLPPAEVLPAYGNRLVTWHLRQSRNGVWWEDLDTGDIDYGWIADYAARHGLPRFFEVELALEPGTIITRGVVENHRRSREFVRRVFGA